MTDSRGPLAVVVERLAAEGVPHAPSGAAALATHGISWSTLDGAITASVDLRIGQLPAPAQALWRRLRNGSGRD